MRNIGAVAIFIASIALVSGQAVAESATAEAQKEDPRDRVICKSTINTGTRFKSKVCHTAAQWDKIAVESRRAATEMNGPVIETRRN